jgi:hypothetical protein
VNRTIRELETQCTIRFLVAVLCLAVAVGGFRLLLLGELGGHVLVATVVILVCSIVGWKLSKGVLARLKQLRQIRQLRRYAPYGQRQNVPPDEAIDRIGGKDGRGRGIWG